MQLIVKWGRQVLKKLFYKDLGIVEGKEQWTMGGNKKPEEPAQGLRDFFEEVTLKVKPNE